MTRPRRTPTPLSGAPDAVGLGQYAPKLFRFLARRLRNHRDVEDLVQYAYQRFLQSPQHELVRQPQAYLYRIAANVLNEWALHQQREIVLYDSESADSASETLSRAQVGRDPVGEACATEQELERILAQVPPHYRAVFVLNVRDGLTCREIAAQLGITPLTAKKYLARALAYCRHARWDR